jgi:hypothetical protein
MIQNGVELVELDVVQLYGIKHSFYGLVSVVYERDFVWYKIG